MKPERKINMSYRTLIKNKQRRTLSKTWRTLLIAHEIEKNTYHHTGNLRKAREFAFAAAMYEPDETVQTSTAEPTVIFSRDRLIDKSPGYVFL